MILNAEFHDSVQSLPAELKVTQKVQIVRPVDATEDMTQPVGIDPLGRLFTFPVTDIPPGADGKSAYAYAKDGGYTGTEAEFAEKLARENPTALKNPNALTVNGVPYDGSAAKEVKSTFLVGIDAYGKADKTYLEIMAAVAAGYAVYCTMENMAGLTFPMLCANGDMIGFAGCANATSMTIIITPNNEVDVQSTQFTTEEHDPTVPGWAKSANKPTYTASEVKAVSYESQSLTIAQKTQARTNIGAGTSSFSGNYNDLSNKPSIPTVPTALKNPNALTINGTTYDGSSAVNMTTAINALIDTKLGVIENGSY